MSQCRYQLVLLAEQDSKRREIWGAELQWLNDELSFNLSFKKQIALAKRVPDHYIYLFLVRVTLINVYSGKFFIEVKQFYLDLTRYS